MRERQGKVQTREGKHKHGERARKSTEGRDVSPQCAQEAGRGKEVEGKAHAQERSNSCMKNAGRSTASQKDFTTEHTSQWVAKHMQLR